MKIRDIVTISILSAILFVLQIGLAFVPNIEVVSFLIIIYTKILKKKVFFIIYIFAFLESIFYGFGVWTVSYLYIWTILAVVTLLFIKNESLVVWALISGLFGLAYGFLCSWPYFMIDGVTTVMVYWVKGIPFDLLHGAGNMIVMFILYKPVYRFLSERNLLADESK